MQTPETPKLPKGRHFSCAVQLASRHRAPGLSSPVNGKVIHRFILPDLFTLRFGNVILIIEIKFNSYSVGVSTLNKTRANFISRKRVRMVVDDTISQALNRIAEAIEENSVTLNKILAHYDSVVPSMKEGADRSNKFGRMAEFEKESEDIARSTMTGAHN